MSNRKELLSKLLALSESERADLAYGLIRSLDGADADADCHDAWRVELSARHARLESGSAKTRDLDEVLSDVDRMLNEESAA